MSQGSPWGPQGLLLWEAVIDWWVLSMVSVNYTCYAHTSPSNSGRGIGAENTALLVSHVTSSILHVLSLLMWPQVSLALILRLEVSKEASRPFLT